MRCKECKDKFIPKAFNQKFCMLKDDCIKAFMGSLKEQRKKDWNKHKAERMPVLYPKKYKGYLNSECQKLARKIDNHFNFNCIDCDRPFAAQQDGGHFNSKGKKASLSWNLHNIHSQRSECNCNGLGGGRERQYYDGLIKRYGQEYAEYVDIGLQKEYKYIGLNENEVAEKLAIVRKINREFDNIVNDLELNSIDMRSYFNGLIGIYKNN
jgi:hypothetical protein